MQNNLNSVALQIRLLLLTMLIAVVGFAFVSQYSDSSSYSDDTPRVRVIEMQEFLNDSEPLLNGDLPDFLATSFLFVCVSLFLASAVNRNLVTPRLTFLYHIQPRSPPLH